MQRTVLVTLTLVALFGAACGNDSPQDGSAATTTSSTVERTDTSLGAPPHGCPGASDDSPTTFDSSEGTYAVFITAFPSADAPLTFDVVHWMSGEPAREAYEADHPEEPGGPPNGFYVRNESTETRSAPIDDDAQVWLVNLAEDADSGLDSATPADLASYLQDREPTDVFWLTFDEGTMVEACEQYRP